MKIFTEIPENINLFKNPVVTIGTFDGVHRGHQKIFSVLKEESKKNNGESIVITFRVHPRKILNPLKKCQLITTCDEKIYEIKNQAVDNLIILNFTKDIAEMSAFDFYNETFVQKLKAKEIVIGYDHAFGKNREGNLNFLKKLSSTTGIKIKRVEEFLMESRPLSSTWIRESLADGDFESTEKLLGREYSLSGEVEHGKGIGRDMGFPTANILPENSEKIIPKDGVYAVRVQLAENEIKDGMLNVGTNPTFGNNRKTIEVNIFDFTKNIYGEKIKIFFVKKLRDEKKFNTPDELVNQLKLDRDMAKSSLRHEGVVIPYK